MADELQESKQQHHAALAAEHKRKAEFHEAHAGGQSSMGQPTGGTSAGGQLGDFVGAIGEHKWLIIGGGAAIIFLIIILRNQSSGNAAANQSPDYSSGGYLPSNISAALDSINQQLSSLGQQQQSGGDNTGTGGNPPPKGIFCMVGYTWDGSKCVPSGTGIAGHPKGTLYTNTSSGVLHLDATGSQTISQIAAQYHLKWQDIANIPENIREFGHMSANSRPKADAGLVLPKKLLGNNYYMVPSTGGQNTLSGIAQLEGTSLARIEQLNPNIQEGLWLNPGQEVQFQ